MTVSDWSSSLGPAGIAALARYTPDAAAKTACLLIAPDVSDATLAATFPNACHISSEPTVQSIPDDQRFDIAIVSSAFALQRKSPAAAILAALRDRHARCVAIVGDEHAFTNQQLVALGFEQTEVGGAVIWLFDPDAESRRRDWNDARHWANPENFDKYRW